MNCSVIGIFSATADMIEAPAELAVKLRRADAHIIMAVSAAHQVLEKHRQLIGEQGELCGLVFASAFGPMETNFDVLDQVVYAQPVSPTLFSHSVFNGAAGYIASTLGIRGSSLSVTDFAFPFFRSLELGRLLLAGNQLDVCLVIQVETYSRLLEDARITHARDTLPWEQGAVCWLLKKTEEDAAGSPVIESIEINTVLADARRFPAAGETLTVNGDRCICSTSLEAASALSGMILAGKGYDCLVESAAGAVSLRIGQ